MNPHALHAPVIMLPEYIGIIIIYITVSVTTVRITPAGDNNVVYIIEGETRTFTCTTDSSRPPAWIQSYNYYLLYYNTSDNSDTHSTGDNNVVDIIEGETHTFTCTADSSSSCCLDTVV